MKPRLIATALAANSGNGNHCNRAGCEPSSLSGYQRYFWADQIGWIGYVEQ